MSKTTTQMDIEELLPHLDMMSNLMYQLSESWFGDTVDHQDPRHFIIALTGEWGEFCNAWKKIDRRDDIDHDGAQWTIGQEIADVLIYLLILSRVLGIDLGWHMFEKLTQNLERFGK